MGKRSILKRLILLPILGLLFATILAPITSVPVGAIPEPTSNDTTTSEDSSEESTSVGIPFVLEYREDESESTNSSENTETEESQESCFAVVDSLGWFICPVTSVVTTAVDALYGLISNFLVVEPITFNDESAIYIVWSTARDIANIVFIIFIVVVIFSQLTGVGFDNYNIKKTLPRIVIAAILVNLSFLICSLAVDVSNLTGASVNGFFDSITNNVKASASAEIGEMSWTNVIGSILGTAGTYAGAGVITVAAIRLAGGLKYLIWPIIFVVLSAIISLAIGLFTIALRQAVVALLIMVAPLAFVAYLLPNTEQYFKKWKDILLQMLIFFPLFAALYGASNLAGWTFIINGSNSENVNIIQILVGMAIQVVPLIVSFKLLQMSNTILGKVSSTLESWAQPLRTGLKGFTDTQAAIAKARYDANNMSRRYEGFSRYDPARLRSFAAKRQAEMEENRRLAEDTRQKILQEYTLARQMNKEITFDKNGRRVLSDSVTSSKMNSTMTTALRNKEAALNLSHMELSRDNALGQAGTYAEQHGINDEALNRIVAQQADNWLDLKTETNAKRRNDLADEQFYANEILKASRKSEDSEDYKRLIQRGGGVDAFSTDRAKRNSALNSVIANAYDITEAERVADINRTTTFLNTQPTENVEASLKTAMDNKDVNSIMAGLNILDARGDGDIAAKYVRQYMDAGNLHLGTEYANNLAKAMLQYSENQLLKGLGKMINVETLAYTQGRRSSDVVTFKEFATGEADFYELDKDGNHVNKYKPKYDIISTTRGKDFSKANRTTMKAIMEAMAAYDVTDENGNDLMAQRIEKLDDQIRPQLVTAIPNYNSGSEEILAAAKYLTGMVQDGEGGWKFDGKVQLPDGSERQYDMDFFRKRAEKYFRAFTPGDLLKTKSDILGATKQLFADIYMPESELSKSRREQNQTLLAETAAKAKVDFQAMFANKKDGGNGAMATLLAGDLSNLGSMKEGLRDILDLNSEQLDDTLNKYGIERKKK